LRINSAKNENAITLNAQAHRSPVARRREGDQWQDNDNSNGPKAIKTRRLVATPAENHLTKKERAKIKRQAKRGGLK
jgi:hypothetical protein